MVCVAVMTLLYLMRSQPLWKHPICNDLWNTVCVCECIYPYREHLINVLVCIYLFSCVCVYIDVFSCAHTLQHATTRCNNNNTLQHTAAVIYCNTLQHTAILHCNALQHTAAYYSILQHVHMCDTTHSWQRMTATPHSNTLQRTATCCNTLQHVHMCDTIHARHMYDCDTARQHFATYCNILQHVHMCDTSHSRHAYDCNTALHCTVTRSNTLQHVHMCDTTPSWYA